MIQQSCQLRKQDWVPTRTFCSAHPIEKAASSVPLWLGKQQAPKSAREQQTRHVLPPSQTCGGEEERDSTQRITEYPHLGYRDPQGPSKPNSWLHVGSLRIETLCLRALSKHCLSSGIRAVPTALCSPFHSHCPLGQNLSLTPPKTPPNPLLLTCSSICLPSCHRTISTHCTMRLPFGFTCHPTAPEEREGGDGGATQSLLTISNTSIRDTKQHFRHRLPQGLTMCLLAAEMRRAGPAPSAELLSHAQPGCPDAHPWAHADGCVLSSGRAHTMLSMELIGTLWYSERNQLLTLKHMPQPKIVFFLSKLHHLQCFSSVAPIKLFPPVSM